MTKEFGRVSNEKINHTYLYIIMEKKDIRIGQQGWGK